MFSGLGWLRELARELAPYALVGLGRSSGASSCPSLSCGAVSCPAVTCGSCSCPASWPGCAAIAAAVLCLSLPLAFYAGWRLGWTAREGLESTPISVPAGAAERALAQLRLRSTRPAIDGGGRQSARAIQG